MPRTLVRPSRSTGELPQREAGVVVALFNLPAAQPNEGLREHKSPQKSLRERQYEIQCKMLEEALKNAPPAIDLTMLYTAKTQPVSFNPVKAEQATLQENSGSIFSSGYSRHFCFV